MLRSPCQSVNVDFSILYCETVVNRRREKYFAGSKRVESWWIHSLARRAGIRVELDTVRSRDLFFERFAARLVSRDRAAERAVCVTCDV